MVLGEFEIIGNVAIWQLVNAIMLCPFRHCEGGTTEAIFITMRQLDKRTITTITQIQTLASLRLCVKQ